MGRSSGGGADAAAGADHRSRWRTGTKHFASPGVHNYGLPARWRRFALERPLIESGAAESLANPEEGGLGHAPGRMAGTEVPAEYASLPRRIGGGVMGDGGGSLPGERPRRRLPYGSATRHLRRVGGSPSQCFASAPGGAEVAQPQRDFGCEGHSRMGDLPHACGPRSEVWRHRPFDPSIPDGVRHSGRVFLPAAERVSFRIGFCASHSRIGTFGMGLRSGMVSPFQNRPPSEGQERMSWPVLSPRSD
jgi:hypothetical protein